MPWNTGESVHSLAYYFGLVCRGGQIHTKYQGAETQVMATARILSLPEWQGVATDIQNMMEVEHRVWPLPEYYPGLPGRGWPLTGKIFRMWNTGFGHCQNIILACLAVGGH